MKRKSNGTFIKRFKPFERLGDIYTGFTGDPRAGMAGPMIDRWADKYVGPYMEEATSLKKSMPPFTKKRKSVSGGKARSNYANERGATDRQAAVKKGKKKFGVSLSRVKKVKVSKDFKAKVSKVIESKKIHGHVEITSVGILPRIEKNLQTVGFASTAESYSGDYLYRSAYQMWAFAPEWFLSCASVLFNKKPYAANITSTGTALMRWYDQDQIGAGGAQGADNTEGIFYGQAVVSNNAVFTVSNAWEKYLIRNNSQRTITMKIYLCAPKRQGALFEDRTLSATGNVGQSADYINDPTTTWINGLGAEIGTGKNLAGITPSFMHANPTDCAQFAKEYKTEVTSIVLEPGQTFDYFIQGPKNFDISYGNLFKNGLHMFIQKCMRFPMFVYHSDLLGTAAAPLNLGNNLTVGSRAGMPNPGATGVGLIIERRRFCRVSCPEKAGMRIDQAISTGSIQLGFHRPAYFKAYLAGLVDDGETSSRTRVDEENPVPALGTPNVIG